MELSYTQLTKKQMKKQKSEISPIIEKNEESITVTWSTKDNIKGKTFRIEW